MIKTAATDAAPQVFGLCWNPEWTATKIGPSSVRLSAGADRQLDLDGLIAEDADAVPEWAAGRCDASALSDVVMSHLVEIGVAQPTGTTNGDTDVSVTVIAADPAASPIADAVSALLERRQASHGASTLNTALGDRSDDADLAVIVRCGPGQIAADPGRARLIVDVGAHHTIVVGPFVVPGRSACEECLDHLLRRRWTPPAQPMRPATVESSDLVAALVVRHVELAVAGSSPVINNTIAFDLDSMVARRDPLLMSPICRTCNVTPPHPRPELPWETA